MQHNELNLLNVPVLKTSFQTALRSSGVDHLKTHLAEEWQMFDQKTINWAIKQW